MKEGWAHKLAAVEWVTEDGLVGLPCNPCVHYWQLDEPHGSVSLGVCKRCGEVRMFMNYVALSFSDYKDELSSLAMRDEGRNVAVISPRSRSWSL